MLSDWSLQSSDFASQLGQGPGGLGFANRFLLSKMQEVFFSDQLMGQKWMRGGGWGSWAGIHLTPQVQLAEVARSLSPGPSGCPS